MSKPERDILAAANERIIVFDGGMGATLERFVDGLVMALR